MTQIHLKIRCSSSYFTQEKQHCETAESHVDFAVILVLAAKVSDRRIRTRILLVCISKYFPLTHVVMYCQTAGILTEREKIS